jgi:CRP-like cAMP-binding protein
MVKSGRNQLIDGLPEGDRGELLSLCQVVDLQSGQVLYPPGQPALQVYFPTSAYLSLQNFDPSVEVMMIGFEGALGAQLVLNSGPERLLALAQADGQALRIATADFMRQLQRSAPLSAVIHAYLAAMFQQIAISCGCLQHHPIDARLARRLLMTHDRARRNDFHVTHAFLASVLGVRRVGVTNAATHLQRAGLISYQRGEVSVLDRKGLESSACSCYAASRRSYAAAMTRSRRD